MAQQSTVCMDDKYHILVPATVRKQLNLHKGDRFILDIQGELIILLPEPASYTDRLAGLHRELWSNVDGDQYLRGERDSWERSTNT